MIARDSKSYPYLAIAQHCGEPYSKILEFSVALCRLYALTGNFGPAPYVEWRYHVWALEREKILNNG